MISALIAVLKAAAIASLPRTSVYNILDIGEQL